jgi:hypothetical protein
MKNIEDLKKNINNCIFERNKTKYKYKYFFCDICFYKLRKIYFNPRPKTILFHLETDTHDFKLNEYLENHKHLNDEEILNYFIKISDLYHDVVVKL